MTALAVLTVLVSLSLKLSTAGWLTILFGIPYLVLGAAHIVVHAIHEFRPAFRKSPSRALASDGAFLLAFLLQWDIGDGPSGWFTITALPCGGPGGATIGNCLLAPEWWPGELTNVVAFVPVIVTWVVLLKKAVDKGPTV